MLLNDVPDTADPHLAFLMGGGRMGDAIRDHDWSASALGAPEGWPSELKAALATMLASPQAMFLAWGEDLVFFFNDAYRPVLDGRIKQALGAPARTLWTDIWSAVEPLVTKALAGEGSKVDDFPVTVRRNGRPYETWWSFIYTPVRDAMGSVRGLSGTITETTDQALLRRRAEVERDQRVQLIQKMPGFIAVLTGPDQLYAYVNDAYERISGPREFVGRGVREVFPELIGQGFIELLDHVYATGEPSSADAMPIRLNGEDAEHFLDFVCEPIRDESGTVVGVFIGGYDITARRFAEQALAASEAEFRTFAQAMPNHVWASPPDGLLNWFNERVYEYGGAKLGELDGTGWTSMVHPEDRAGAGERWGDALASGQIYETEFRLRRADGVYRWHIARALPIRGANGEITRWIGTNTDIDDQKSAVEALAHLNATLEHQVVERTTELMNAEEALRQSQKMEAVGQLTGGIAHDFNNMLAVVLGSLDLLGRRIGVDDPRARRHLDGAVNGAKRAALLTQRLLAFARQQPLRPEPIELNGLIAGMSELLHHSLGGEVRLETVLAAGLWRTHADPNQLENAIINVAVNGRDAMPGGGRLTIETHNAYLDDRYAAAHFGVPAGQYVLIAISDSGSGMPAEIIAKAFEPFFTTKAVGKGTGLGLSQVYGFVKQSGGHVKIYSEQGQGTTVKLYLPRLVGPGTESPKEDVEASPISGDTQEVVLVVEDEPAVRQFTVDALEELRYRVLEADGAAAALRLLDTHPEITLLLTDVIMPDVNGRKLADEATRRRPDLRVLFTTGYTRNAVVHNGVLDPGVQLIGKPFTLEELAAKVRDVLDMSRP